MYHTRSISSPTELLTNGMANGHILLGVAADERQAALLAQQGAIFNTLGDT